MQNRNIWKALSLATYRIIKVVIWDTHTHDQHAWVWILVLVAFQLPANMHPRRQ